VSTDSYIEAITSVSNDLYIGLTVVDHFTIMKLGLSTPGTSNPKSWVTDIG